MEYVMQYTSMQKQIISKWNIKINAFGSIFLMYLDANNFYGWGMSQKLRVNIFKWIKKLSKFDDVFIKDYYETSNREYILEEDVEYPKKSFQFA